MNKIFQSIALITSLALTHIASANDYTVCSTSGCSYGGSAWTYSNYAHTRYPIILAHGMGGFSQIGPIDYFYGIPEDLASNGANVFITQVASFQSSEVRGEQLLQQVQQILAITGAQKVNLIGHSQGSLDVRYVAAVAPKLVASVTAVGGPNRGSPVADVVSGVLSVTGPLGTAVTSSIINGFFALVDVTSGQNYEQNALAGMVNLTTAGAAAFNSKYPQALPAASNPCSQGNSVVNGVHYYSWSGTSVLTNIFDVSDAALGITSLAFSGAPNDGLVGQCSSHLGSVIRDNYSMNHLDEVNQLFGLVDIFATSPVTLFRNQANRLKSAGL